MLLPKLSLLLSVLGTTALVAQGPPDGPVHQAPGQVGMVRSHRVLPTGPDLAQPPRSVSGLPSHGPLPQVPEGPEGRPLADVPPVSVRSSATANANVGAGDFRLFSVRQVGGGGSRSSVGEPSVTVANNKTAAFATGNWFAAHSANAGASWTNVNPYTRFPASDGGFCCDQLVLSAPGGATFWYLQYVRNGSGNNRARIAISKTAADLQANRWSHYYDFTAQNFGLASGIWLDYPSMAVSNNRVWFSSNAFRGGSYVDAVVWNLKISDMVGGGSVPFNFARSSALAGGGSLRFTQGATTRMYWATHQSTTQLRLYWRDDAGGNYFWQTKTISRWSGSNLVVRDRSGNNWAERADSRISGGFFAGSRFGFAWHSAPVTGRPEVHIRLVAFDSTSRALNLDTQLWSPGWHHLYPAAAGNADGTIGLKMAIGRTGDFPRAAAALHDDLGHSGVLYYASSTSSPGTSWGDYFTTNRHNNLLLENTFFGSGLARIGDERSYLVQYGREAYRDGFVGLRVLSQPQGVSITASSDRFSQGAGRTPFLRSYARQSRYTVTAPLTATIGGVVHVFQRWRVRAVPGGSYSNLALGARTYTPVSIGSQADSVEAVFVRRRTLTVRSTNPTSGTAITIAPNDINGRGTGNTALTRFYRNSETVTLTAPAVRGINPFSRWLLNGRAQPTGTRTLRVTMTRDNLAVAEYRVRVRGTYTSYGRGCPGTNNVVPVHTGSGTPEIGRTLSWNVSRVPPNLPIGLHFAGRSQAVNLAPFGMPGCTWLVATEVVFNGRSDLAGTSRLSVPIGINRSWIGASVYTQYGVIDPGGPGPLKINWSNGLRTTIGGVR